MKTFDQRWQECAARARTAPPEDTTAPFGFAERVLVRRSRSETFADSAQQLWLSLSLRALATVSAAFVISATIFWSFLANPKPLRPPIEHSIVDYSKLL